MQSRRDVLRGCSNGGLFKRLCGERTRTTEPAVRVKLDTIGFGRRFRLSPPRESPPPEPPWCHCQVSMDSATKLSSAGHQAMPCIYPTSDD
jgi:hypothetical protein